MSVTDPLRTYRAKRKFQITAEPAGKVARRGKRELVFVVQKHTARSLHYDFRLELNGVLKSWAIPKGPSLDPLVKRMAVQVEDHPLEYADFEGEIPAGQYGAGSVIVWDRGKWTPVGNPEDGLRNGKLEFALHGSKLAGKWALIRMRQRDGERRPSWLLVKQRDADARREDEYSVIEAEPDSVKKRRRVARMPRVAPGRVSQDKGAQLPKGVRITHGDRVVDPSTGITKLEVMRYHAEAAKLLLAQLRGRPVALLRGPEGLGGTLFFQKHAGAMRIPGIKRLDPKLDPGHEPLIEIASVEALLGAVQMNVLEFHTWNACVRAIERPDRMVFDLDPGAGVTWRRVREAAQLVRASLEDLELVSFLKTSGARGLHIVVPLQPRFDWDTVRAVAQALMQRLVSVAPDRFAAKSGAKNRVGRIFVDYLRNGRGATTVAAWSVRARPGLGVSVPVAWEELQSLRSGDHWTVRNVAERLVAPDPWTGYAKTRQGLRPALEALAIKVSRASR